MDRDEKITDGLYTPRISTWPILLQEIYLINNNKHQAFDARHSLLCVRNWSEKTKSLVLFLVMMQNAIAQDAILVILMK